MNIDTEMIANSSFFLTGHAGTGKTTFLRNVQKMVDKQFITLAPTGVAAILTGGDTIHSKDYKVVLAGEKPIKMVMEPSIQTPKKQCLPRKQKQ